MLLSRIVLIAAAVLIAAPLVTTTTSCGTTKKAHHKKKIKPQSDEDMAGNGAATPQDTHFAEVRKAAAEQLACPVEQINIVCLHRDSEGECVSIRADGCDKSYEYQFGEPGG